MRVEEEGKRQFVLYYGVSGAGHCGNVGVGSFRPLGMGVRRGNAISSCETETEDDSKECKSKKTNKS